MFGGVMVLFAGYMQWRSERREKDRVVEKSALSGSFKPPKIDSLRSQITPESDKKMAEQIVGELDFYEILKRPELGETRIFLIHQFCLLDTVEISFGDVRFSEIKRRLESGHELTPFGIGDGIRITVKLRNDTILLSGSFRSLDGNTVAEIVDNEWQINPNNYFARNYDHHGLEIIDRDGIMKVQIDFIDKDSIIVNGFFKVDGVYSLVTRDKWEKWPEGTLATKADLIKASEKLSLMFRYPSDKHFGKRAKLK